MIFKKTLKTGWCSSAAAQVSSCRKCCISVTQVGCRLCDSSCHFMCYCSICCLSLLTFWQIWGRMGNPIIILVPDVQNMIQVKLETSNIALIIDETSAYLSKMAPNQPEAAPHPSSFSSLCQVNLLWPHWSGVKRSAASMTPPFPPFLLQFAHQSKVAAIILRPPTFTEPGWGIYDQTIFFKDLYNFLNRFY